MYAAAGRRRELPVATVVLGAVALGLLVMDGLRR
jgi:hypothetical protein